MWPSRTSWNWNAVDIGPKRDIVGKGIVTLRWILKIIFPSMVENETHKFEVTLPQFKNRIVK